MVGDPITSGTGGRFRGGLESIILDSERLRFGAAPGVQQLDREGRFLTVSTPLAQLCGWTEQELAGRRFWELAAEDDDRRLLEDRFRAMIRGEVPGFVAKCGHARKEGGQFWAGLRAFAAPGANGGIAGAVYIIEDDTHDREAADAARQLAELVEQSTDFIGIARLDLSIVFINPAGLRLVGLESLDAARAKRVPDYFPEQERDFVSATLVPAVHENGFWQGEQTFRNFSTGEMIPVWCNTFLLRDAQGRITGYGTATRDLRELHKNEGWLIALLQLGDQLRDLHNPAQIAVAAAEMIGRLLGATRAGYAVIAMNDTVHVERDWTDGTVASIAGTWHLPTYWNLARLAEEPPDIIAVSDVAADPRAAPHAASYAAISTQALLLVPVMVKKGSISFLFVHDSLPREWSSDEISFARGAAERAWGAMERAAAELRQTLMTRELNHQVKNTLAVVQAIALQIVRSTTDLASFGPSFQARLIALARAHDLLTQADWQGVCLSEVLQAGLATGGNIQVDLQDCPDDDILPSAQALSLTMALHELLTNAVKHGALSAPGGSVSVTCRMEADGTARIVEWTERGGPRLHGAPARKGFGMRLLGRGLAAQSGMVVRMDFRPEGLHCVLHLPRLALPPAAA